MAKALKRLKVENGINKRKLKSAASTKDDYSQFSTLEVQCYSH
jgi:hypothetical protein